MQAAMHANGCRCTISVICFRRPAIVSPLRPDDSAGPDAAEAGVAPGVDASLLWAASAGPAPSAILCHIITSSYRVRNARACTAGCGPQRSEGKLAPFRRQAVYQQNSAALP